MGLDHLKRKKPDPKPMQSPRRLDGPQGKAPKAKVRFSCGHEHEVGVFSGQLCPRCRGDKQRKRKEERKKAKENPPPRPLDTSGRLPDKSCFSVTYDASDMTWSGVLRVEGFDPPFFHREGGLFRLLAKLDGMYREAVKNKDSGGLAATEKKD